MKMAWPERVSLTMKLANINFIDRIPFQSYHLALAGMPLFLKNGKMQAMDTCFPGQWVGV